ncbi:MAG TPA: hypothetical protein VMZ66_00570 [Aeromicrobium sp.]|nr:hypothetical protein [Aeromicrobium sp.]
MGSIVEAVAEPFVDAGEALVDTVDDTVSAAGDFAWGAVDTAATTFADVVDTAATGIYDAGDAFVTEVATPIVDDVIAPVAQDVLAPAWETALDGLDFVDDITPDIPFVDVSFEGGQIGAGVDIEGYGGGISIGEHGASANADLVLVGGNVGLTDEGYALGMHIGDTDWPKEIPAFGFGVGGDYDGNVEANFEAQGTFPLPSGALLSAEAGANFHYNYDDGTWGVGGKAGADYYSATGTNIGGSAHAQYERTVDGESFTAGAEGHLGIIGGPQVGIGGEYAHIEQGGNEFTSFSGGGTFSGYGLHADGRVGYQSSMVDGVERTDISASGGVGGYGIEARGSAQYDEMTTADGRTTSNFTGSGAIDGFGAHIGTDGVNLPFAGGDAGSLLGLAQSFPGLDGAMGSLDLGDDLGGILGSTGFDPGQLGGMLDGGGFDPGDLGGMLDGGGFQAGNLGGLLGSGGFDPGQLGGLLNTGGLSGSDIFHDVDLREAAGAGDGSPWSMGTWLAGQGADALSDLMPPMDSQEPWSGLDDFARSAGVDLPSWATDLANNGLPSNDQLLQGAGVLMSEAADGIGPYDGDLPTVPDWFNDPLSEAERNVWDSVASMHISDLVSDDSPTSSMWSQLESTVATVGYSGGDFLDDSASGGFQFADGAWGSAGTDDQAATTWADDQTATWTDDDDLVTSGMPDDGSDDTSAWDEQGSASSGGDDDYGLYTGDDDASSDSSGWDDTSAATDTGDYGDAETTETTEYADDSGSDASYDDSGYDDSSYSAPAEEAPQESYEESAPAADYESYSEDEY